MDIKFCIQTFCLISSFLAVLSEIADEVVETQNTNSNSCDAVKYAYKKLDGASASEVPALKVSGGHLQICGSDRSCCTGEMEVKLRSHSQSEFKEMLQEKIVLLQNTFHSRHNKFDDFFTSLLDESKQDLHEMFTKTYGILYEQNSAIFMDLFRDLRAYYKGRDMNLLEVLDNFFSDLLERMFVLLHADYDFDDDYLECITSHMNDLKPFGDVPMKMSGQVKKSFIAARTFVQGLQVGRDLVTAISQWEMTSSCKDAVTKMRYCPYCSGVPYIKPCNNYCMNVMKGCLANYADLNAEWNSYIDGLKALADRLEGPYNIEAVVGPIDVKISNAIMNFQEGSTVITNKVFAGCGQPTRSADRRKRDMDSSYSEYSYDGWKHSPKGQVRASLEKLVQDIERKVSSSRDFFHHLADNVCNDVATQVYDEDNCWNGIAVDSYLPDVLEDGVQNQINNPEVEVDTNKESFALSQQLLRLKLITNKLRSAHSGVDVDWIDTADVIDVDGSGDGSGSGSGSGDGFDFNDGDSPISFVPRVPGDTSFTRPGDDVNRYNPDITIDDYNYPDIIFDPNDPGTSAAASAHSSSMTSLLAALLLTFVLVTSSRWQWPS